MLLRQIHREICFSDEFDINYLFFIFYCSVSFCLELKSRFARMTLARMPLDPRLDHRVLVDRVVVADQVKPQMRWGLAVDSAQEVEPLEMAVTCKGRRCRSVSRRIGIARYLESRRPVRFQASRFPDALDGGVAHPRQRAGAPLHGTFWLCLGHRAHDLACIHLRFAPAARQVSLDGSKSASGISAAPTSGLHPAPVEHFANVVVVESIGRQEHDACAPSSSLLCACHRQKPQQRLQHRIRRFRHQVVSAVRNLHKLRNADRRC